MPPRARLRLTPIVQLERQLEFAGAEAVRRIVKAAEAATREVDRDGLLSEAWIVERLTGVKSRDAERATVLVGQAVAMDLSALALRLSERAPLQPSDLPGGAVTLVHGANDLGVTVRSLQRWRRQGLAMVRVRTPAGVRTALSGKALSWCRERLLGSVASRRRDPVRRASVMAVAATEARAGETLHAVARRVAKKAGVSVASARRMIAAAERKGVVPTLRRRETVQPSARRAAWRAWRRGTELLPVAQSIARSEAATLRLVRRERRDRLRALRLGASPLATFTRADAADTLLAPRAVRSGLAVEPWPVEARAFLRRFPPAAQGERTTPADAQRLVALRYLLWHAALEVGTLRGSDPGERLDPVETRLRWAARLRLTLIERALPGALGRLQSMRGGPLQGLPPAALRRAIVAAVHAAGTAVDEAMAGELSIERPRLAALAGAVVERSLAGAVWLRPGTAGRDAEVSLPESLRERSVAWCAVLPLRDDLAAAAVADNDPGAQLLTLRFGWQGEAPRTAAEAATQLRIDPRRAAMTTAQAFRRLRAHARTR